MTDRRTIQQTYLPTNMYYIYIFNNSFDHTKIWGQPVVFLCFDILTFNQEDKMPPKTEGKHLKFKMSDWKRETKNLNLFYRQVIGVFMFPVKGLFAFEVRDSSGLFDIDFDISAGAKPCSFPLASNPGQLCKSHMLAVLCLFILFHFIKMF